MGANSVSSSKREAAWRYLLDDGLGATAGLIFLQEAVMPKHLPDHEHKWVRAWPSRSWGTAVIVRRGTQIEPIELDVTRGRFVLARVEFEDRAMMAASVHAHTGYGDVIPTLRPTIDAILELCSDGPFVIGGDFNTARSAEAVWPGHGHGAFWSDLDARRVYTCFWGEHGNEVRTYAHPSGAFRGQADHVLVDAHTADLSRVASYVDPPSAEYSDHLALVVDLEGI